MLPILGADITCPCPRKRKGLFPANNFFLFLVSLLSLIYLRSSPLENLRLGAGLKDLLDLLALLANPYSSQDDNTSCQSLSLTIQPSCGHAGSGNVDRRFRHTNRCARRCTISTLGKSIGPRNGSVSCACACACAWACAFAGLIG